MVKMSKFVNFMRDYVFVRSVIPIGIIVIAIGIYASTIYGDRKDYPRCEATVTDSELLSGSYVSAVLSLALLPRIKPGRKQIRNRQLSTTQIVSK